MLKVLRSENPVLVPNEKNSWESYAVFNPSVVKINETYHMLYRAISDPIEWQGNYMRVSSIGHAQSSDGNEFIDRKQFIIPEYDWERYGCEDPRIVKVDDKYFIFYTSVSTNPPQAEGIRVSVAITKDFSKILDKHLVTPFNAKAMTLFPEKINGEYVVILTVDTDRPPSKVAIARFSKIEDLWNRSYWEEWYKNLAIHTLPLQRRSQDQVEVGLNPIKTDEGWVLIYSYIQNYFLQNKVFGVEAVLLDLVNPLLIIGKSNGPFMVPESYFEKHGTVSNIIFPTGGILKGDLLKIYYGASDTTVCSATLSIRDLVDQIEKEEKQIPIQSVHSALHLVRFDGNPILSPIQENKWEEKAVLNCGAYQDEKNIYLLYRAMDDNLISSIGLAVTKDGYHITERLDKPIYSPRVFFEKNKNSESGCEDPRLTKIGDTIYMFYVAYDGKIPKVALTSISSEDFNKRNWKWSAPSLISDPNVMDKNSALFPEKINGKYAILHRLDVRIWIDFVSELSDFSNDRWLGGAPIAEPRKDMWDSEKIGISAPPISTELGWLLIYHGLSSHDRKYRLGIMVLDKTDPTKVLLRLERPILEPKLKYELEGVRPGTVFSCGSAILDGKLFVYYGAGDSKIGVAQIEFSYLIDKLKKHINKTE